MGAGAIVWGALVAPDRLELLTPAAFLRIPVEGLVLVAIALVLPARPRRIVAIVAGVLFGLLAVFKVFDVVLYQEFARPFNPVIDWGNVGPAIGVVRDSIGTLATGVALVLVVLGLALVVALVTVAAVRLTTRNRPPSAEFGGRCRRPGSGRRGRRDPVDSGQPRPAARLDQHGAPRRLAGARRPGERA